LKPQFEAPVEAVVRLLEVMTDPENASIRNTPVDDEPVTEEEKRAVAASKEWFKTNPGIPFEEVVANVGLTIPCPPAQIIAGIVPDLDRECQGGFAPLIAWLPRVQFRNAVRDRSQLRRQSDPPRPYQQRGREGLRSEGRIILSNHLGRCNMYGRFKYFVSQSYLTTVGPGPQSDPQFGRRST
jgi:hypothetical protein